MKKNKLTMAAVISFLLVAVMAVGVWAAYSGSRLGTAQLPANVKSTSTNKDDLIDHIKVTPNSIGGFDYTWEVSSTYTTIEIGTKITIGDYMYVYGKYYNGTGAVTAASSWSDQTVGMDIGWGAAVVSKTKTSYEAIAGNIQGAPVTNLNNAFSGCTSMTKLPELPETALNTDGICTGCAALKEVSLTGVKVIGANAFKNCSALKKVYIGQSVATIGSNAFSGINANCKCYIEKPYTAAWWSSVTSETKAAFAKHFATSGTGSFVKYGADYSIDYLCDIPIGTVVTDADYMYVYGMYYGAYDFPANTASTAKWTKQNSFAPDAIGWGAVAIDHTKEKYMNPMSTINGYPVNNFTRAFYDCDNMPNLPILPNNIVADEMTLNAYYFETSFASS